MDTAGKPVGIKDVAAAAGVSIATVSNVINETKQVSPELRQRVNDAVDLLGYRANAIARGLKRGRTNALCVIVPSIMSVFFPRVLHGMQMTAAEHGFSLSIYETDQRISNEQAILERLREQWVDGILLSTSANPKVDMAYLDALAHLSVNGRHIPVVCYEAVPHRLLDAVVVDHYASARDAVTYLCGLGRTRVGHISAPLRFAMGQSRQDGYLAALEAAGILPSEALLVEGDYSPQSGYDGMQVLLQRGTLPPDAVFCGNDQMAIGAIYALKEHGLRIPQDVAVMGFDNNYPGTLVSPSLSTVSVPKMRLGCKAVELLCWRLEQGPPTAHHDAPRIITLDTHQVIRQSTDPGAPTQWELQDW